MRKRRCHWSASRSLGASVFLIALSLWNPTSAPGAEAPGLGYEQGDLSLSRDRSFPAMDDPGKLRREILLTGDGGGIYIMVWDLTRLHPAEWLERAIGPALTGSRFWTRAWLPGSDFAAVVEVPGGVGSRDMRVYGVRLGDVGVAILCNGVDDPTLSETCDGVAGSLEVLP